MKNSNQLSPMRFYAMLMIGTGLVSIGVVFFAFLNNPTASSENLITVPAQVDFVAPELILTDLSGKSVSLNDYRGSVVLVNLWATWCPPCQEEMPGLQAFYDKHKAEGFVLIGIDQEETAEVVKPFVARYDLTFPVWLDENYEAEKKFKTESLPSSFVIDGTGMVRMMWFGGVSEQFLEKYVTKLIKE